MSNLGLPVHFCSKRKKVTVKFQGKGYTFDSITEMKAKFRPDFYKYVYEPKPDWYSHQDYPTRV